MRAAPLEEKICETCGSRVPWPAEGEDDLGCMTCLLRVGLDREASGLPDDDADQFHDIGVYEIQRDEDGKPVVLGRGAMGVTYRAIDRSLERPIALKMIASSLRGRNGPARERFIREARAAAALRHPNVATVYQFGAHEGSGECFYAMELVEGETLEEHVRRAGPLTPLQAIDIALQVTNALGAAEERGLVHRDLKPGNIMLVHDDARGGKLLAKVIDFGLAKAISRGDHPMALTHNGFVGTPAFASPEQFANATVDVRSDIYSFGVTLWFALTGELPLAGRTLEEIRDAQHKCPLPLHQLHAARVPKRLIALLQSMLALKPAARPDVQTLARKLERCRAHLQHTKARRVYIGLAAAAALIVAALLAWQQFGNKTLSSQPKGIAVLPFDHPGADETGALLANGLYDDVLVSLSKVADLKVIARDSVQRYAGAHPDPAEVGRSLGVDAVLVGSVRQSGNQARVNVHLMRAADSTELWADNFDRELKDVLATQGDLALQIASALKATVLPMEANGIRRRPTTDSQAYLRYVQARDLLYSISKGGPKLAQVKQLLEEAIARDPKFALAIALLSEVETFLQSENEAERDVLLAAAKTHAEEALRLQPDLPEAHTAMGVYFWQGTEPGVDPDLDQALREFEIAQRNRPGNAENLYMIGRVQARQGNYKEAEVNLERAAALDPNTAERWNALYAIKTFSRKYAAASEALERKLALPPHSWMDEWCRALLPVQWKGDTSGQQQLRAPPPAEMKRYADLWLRALVGSRRLTEAEKFVREFPEETIFYQGVLVPRSFVLARLRTFSGDPAGARQFFEQALPGVENIVRAVPNDPGRHMWLAFVFAGLERKEEAMREGKLAVEVVPIKRHAIDSPFTLMFLGMLYGHLHEPELACAALAESLQLPNGAHIGQMKTHPDFDPLRNEPCFQRLLVRYAPRD
jgi:TolB-like protein